jgi:tetratricopeptide (TPR) repeat protein
MDVVFDAVSSKALDGMVSQLKKAIQHKEIEKQVEASSERYKTRAFGNLPAYETLDWDGLQDYIRRELFGKISASLLWPETAVRNRLGEDVRRRAWSEAHAETDASRRQVTGLIDEIEEILKTAYFQEQGTSLHLNVVADGLHDQLQALPSKVAESIQEIQAQSNGGAGATDVPRDRPPGSLPFNNLPYIQNRYFTESGTILHDIRAGFESGSAVSLTQSITGMGGVGKTQTALEYAYRYADKYDCIWWVTTETDATVLDSYRQFASKKNLVDSDTKDSEVIQAVLNWMDTHDKWLFIYDNAEDVKGDTSWWPRNVRGNALITTRNPHIQIAQRIDVEVFTPENAVAFLEKRTGRENTSGGAARLAERLGYFPLALEQAAAYIKTNEISFDEYLELLATSGLTLLEDTDGVLDYNLSVSATLKVSIKKITLPAATQLLCLCAYFAPENIAPGFFAASAELLPELLKNEMSDPRNSGKLWKELTRYSLLKKQDDGKGYSMHRLLQEVVRERLGSDPSWAARCLALFAKNFDFEYGNTTSHSHFLQLSPHVEAFLPLAQSRLKEDKTQELIAQLYHKGGWGNIYLGNYQRALEWYNKALPICEKVLGKEHPDTATMYHNIAGVYDKKGDYSKALELYDKALAIQEKALGIEHPHTAATYNNIGSVYDKKGDYAKALEWYNKALPIFEKVLGNEHPDTATTYSNIATVYDNQGDYDKALEWYNKALEIKEKVLGKEHPSTATTYNNIASVYDDQGNYPKALEWYNKALAIKEKVLGKEHPSTATTYNNIAGVYDSQGDYPKALEWYNKALPIYEKALGKEHTSTATTYNNIAAVYDSQGKYDKALEWYRKALPIREKTLGKEHPYTIAIHKRIAELQGLVPTP